MAPPTTHLVTGTTRGIGQGLVAALLLRANTTVVAGVRDTTSQAAGDLKDLPKGKGSTLILVKIDSSNEAEPFAAVEEIQSKHGITHLDSVIANAGIGEPEAIARIEKTPASDLRKYFEVNTVAIVLLLQAVLPLLEKAQAPKFMVTTSIAGSITIAASFTKMPVLCYGISKAAVNYVISKAYGEHANITFVAIHPGSVATSMASNLEKATGEALPMISVEECVQGYLDVHDKATRDQYGGKFVQYNGEILPW